MARGAVIYLSMTGPSYVELALTKSRLQQDLAAQLHIKRCLTLFMHQIFELVDGMYQRVRTFFSSRRAFWDEVRSAFRLFLFTSWDQVLERMNSPPEQLPPYGSR